MSHLMNTYARQPVAFARGQGLWLWDEDGSKYLDAIAGVAVNTLGHAHPRFVAALTDQLQRLVHTTNLYRIPLQERAAERLCTLSGMSETFFCNSGLEANEAAIKIARKYGSDRGVKDPTIVVMANAFHGRSLATLSASGNSKIQKGFEPLLGGFERVALNDLDALKHAAERNADIVAVMVEAVQGEGGIHVSHLPYLRALRTLCDQREWLLIADEVQCGLGRTGTWFAYQHAGITPDVLSLAKGLGSGVPVGACLASGRARGVFQPGNHGSTFGGNPFAMRAVNTTLDVIEEEDLLNNARSIGGQLLAEIGARLKGTAGVREVRGLGLMLGIELDRPCGEVVGLAREKSLLVNVTANDVVRLLPALVINQDEAALIVETLVPAINQFLSR